MQCSLLIFGESACDQNISNFATANNQKLKNESRMPNKNADLLIKIGLMIT